MNSLTKKDIELYKKYYPIIGATNPRYHESLMEMTGNSSHQITYFCQDKLKLSIDRNIGTTKDTKWCVHCLKLRSLNEFLKLGKIEPYISNPEAVAKMKGRYNVCSICRKRYQSEILKNIDELLIKRYRVRLMKESTWENLRIAKNNLAQIIKNIGYPKVCFFDDQFCSNDGDPLKLQFGHIQSSKRGGTLSDPNNVIWICSRHNWIMSDRNLKELHKIITSLVSSHG